MSIDRDLAASIAATRFGLGARPGEIQAARGDPAAYLKAQIRSQGADQPAGDFKSSAAQRPAEVRDYPADAPRGQGGRRSGVDPVKQAR